MKTKIHKVAWASWTFHFAMGPSSLRLPVVVNIPQYGNCKEILKAKGEPLKWMKNIIGLSPESKAVIRKLLRLLK